MKLSKYHNYVETDIVHALLKEKMQTLPKTGKLSVLGNLMEMTSWTLYAHITYVISSSKDIQISCSTYKTSFPETTLTAFDNKFSRSDVVTPLIYICVTVIIEKY